MRDTTAASPNHLTSQIDDDEALRAKNEAAIQLLHEWLQDDSGYDEQAWPQLKEAIEEDRLSYRRRFSD